MSNYGLDLNRKFKGKFEKMAMIFDSIKMIAIRKVWIIENTSVVSLLIL